MDRKNINQWNKTNYLDAYPRDYFKSKVEAGQLYVMNDELTGKVVGAVVLLEEDKRWTNDGLRNYYIHNLVSDTEVPGVGIKIINLCEQMALDNGVAAIRLDCQASNIRLNGFYEGLGYGYVGDVQEGSYIGHRREKKL
jgi:ribosomal protein S18 acetylase RimI-like enzyme